MSAYKQLIVGKANALFPFYTIAPNKPLAHTLTVINTPYVK